MFLKLTVIYVPNDLLMLRRYHLILDQFGRCYPLGGKTLLKHRSRYAVFPQKNK